MKNPIESSPNHGNINCYRGPMRVSISSTLASWGRSWNPCWNYYQSHWNQKNPLILFLLQKPIGNSSFLWQTLTINQINYKSQNRMNRHTNLPIPPVFGSQRAENRQQKVNNVGTPTKNTVDDWPRILTPSPRLNRANHRHLGREQQHQGCKRGQKMDLNPNKNLFKLETNAK